MKTTHAPSALNEYEAALKAAMLSSEHAIIKPILALKILAQMPLEKFLEAAAEVAESQELSYGYDLLDCGHEHFYTANREMVLELVSSVMKARYPKCLNEPLLVSIQNMFDDHVYPLVTTEHVKMIMDGYVPKQGVDSEGLLDAYHIVSYQVTSHCIMETCYSFNGYAGE